MMMIIIDFIWYKIFLILQSSLYYYHVQSSVRLLLLLLLLPYFFLYIKYQGYHDDCFTVMKNKKKKIGNANHDEYRNEKKISTSFLL